MAAVAVVLFVVGVTIAGEVPLLEPLSDEMIHYINNYANTTWKAGVNFKGIPLSIARRMCGALKNPYGARLQLRKHVIDRNFIFPMSFDLREHWPNCSSLREIHDQGNCGSCWAVAAATSMTDRICIASNARSNVKISVEDLVSCCPRRCGKGCFGGYSVEAWEYYQSTGLVTGGQYDSEEGCRPYSIPGCSHFDNGTLPRCSDNATTPECVTECQANYALSYTEDKHYGDSTYVILPNEEQIKYELVRRGPIEASFTVFADFLNYKSGIYQHRAGEKIGGHAVRLLGWGEEHRNPYWLLANSWNSEWGDNGYFKILRGRNECGIETELVAGMPRLYPIGVKL